MLDAPEMPMAIIDFTEATNLAVLAT